MKLEFLGIIFLVDQSFFRVGIVKLFRIVFENKWRLIYVCREREGERTFFKFLNLVGK